MEASNKLFAYSSLMQVLAFINPQGLLVTLTVISTFITIAHNGLKLYRDWRNKKSN